MRYVLCSLVWMSKHKKQHYIPKCYLKAWCDLKCPQKQTPYIWIYEKESKDGKKKSPDNFFHETDMYTILDKDGGRILDIEHGLSGLESHFTTVRNKKISRHIDLDQIEKVIVTTFMAAMHARTKSQLAHMADQWRMPLEMMDNLDKKMKVATEEEKRRMANKVAPVSSTGGRGGFTHEQVRQMVEDPVGTTLVPMIRAVAPLIAELDMAILCTDSVPGFITSDRPCVWFDPQSHTRPPLYQGPALMYKTIEITMPVSPTECIFLNRQGMSDYINVDENLVKELNRRVRFHSSEYFVVNQEYTDDMWFDVGKEPEDSWEKQQARKENDTNTKTDS